MSFRNNNVSTEEANKDQRVKFNTLHRNIRDVCSSIFIPAMIGLLTVAIAIVQLRIASQQRQQDLTIAEINQLNSLTIANQTREQDLLIANTLRWDTVFAAYVDDLSKIVSTPNFSFINIDPLIISVIRAKTLTACRQLDVIRKAYLIQFLYELNAVTSRGACIDLDGLELNNIDLSTTIYSSKQKSTFEGLCLTGISLINASFAARHLVNANFSGSVLKGTTFQHSYLIDVSFHDADLKNINFTTTFTSMVDYSGSDLRGSTITDKQLQTAHSIFSAVLPNRTIGSNPTLLINGNGEQETNCSIEHVKSIRRGGWDAVPSDGIGVMRIDPLVVEQTIYPWTEALKQSGVDEDYLNIMSNHFWNVECCSFTISGHYKEASLSQSIRVPKRYLYDAFYRSYSWYLSMFCGSLENHMTVNVTLTELNYRNETLNIHGFRMLPGHGISVRSYPYNENTVFALFKIHFNDPEFDVNNSTVFNKTHPIVFCDNIHLSLELTSITTLISPI